MMGEVNIDVAIVQLVEPLIVNQEVAGSIPAGHPKFNLRTIMKTYKEFLTESTVVSDKNGSSDFGLTTNADGVYFQIGNERFQTSKATKEAVLAVLKGDGTWKGKGAGGKEAGIAIDRKNKSAYFKIGEETFILNPSAYKKLLSMF